MDALDFGTVAAAAGGVKAAQAGKDSFDNPIAGNYYVRRVEQLVFVYPRTYQEDRGGSTATPGVIAPAQTCLDKLGSSAILTEPRRVVVDPVE